MDKESIYDSDKSEELNKSLYLDQCIITKAQEENPFAQLDVGKTYYSSTNIDNNCEKAFYWLKLAADQNNMEAQLLLADLHALGKGTAKNEFTAYEWYIKAAIQGYPKALTRLHNLYNNEKSIICRGQMNSEEEKWTQPDFKKQNNIRELFEFREQQLKAELTHIKQYFEGLIKDCRQKDTEEAYLILGFLYQHGYGIRRITNRAIEHYLLAAEKGNTDACYNLGYIYHHNTDINWNYRESFKWYSEAAKKGHIHAQNGLAFLYLKGLSVDMDYSKALFWYTKSAEGRNVEAKIALAHMFRTGQGTTSNCAKAIEWYRKAVSEGSTVAQNCLDMLCDNEEYQNNKDKDVFIKKGLCSKLRDDISKILNPVDIKDLQQLATHAIIGDSHAMFNIGMKYYNGDDFHHDKNIAFKWILRSAKAGLISSQCAIAKMYKEGDCVEQNYYKASIWYRKAANKKDDNAQLNLGLMYYQGLGVRKDPLEASKWFTFAAEKKNNSDAQYYLGILRLNGEGLRQDTSEAINWLTTSMKQNNPDAIYKLAKMYEAGNGVGQDHTLSLRFIKIAARKGSVDAQMNLGVIYSDKRSSRFDFSKGFKYFEMAAKKKHPEANYTIARMYLDGSGVEQNFIKAYSFFKKAKQLGNTDAENIFRVPIDYRKNYDIDYCKVEGMFAAISRNNIDSIQYNLACMYNSYITFSSNGELSNVTPDYPMAKKWFQIAAKNGDPQAEYMLGTLYEEEIQTVRDAEKAMRCYINASEKNNIHASFKLASIYLEGKGVSQDLKRSFELFNRAADMGYKEAIDILNIPQNLRQRKNHQKIIKMLKEAAISGSVITQYRLGLYNLNRNTSDNHFSMAIKWLRMASKGGFVDAFFLLGQINEAGTGVIQNYKKAIQLYRIAAVKGNENAIYKIARFFHYGQGVEKDNSNAFRFYTEAALQGSPLAQLAVNITTKSTWEKCKDQLEDLTEKSSLQYINYLDMWTHVAEQDNPDIQYKLGLVYEQDSTNLDLSNAISWYLKAAGHFHGDALYRLGQLYENGQGVEQDYKISVGYYKKSSEAGNVDALYQLGIIYQEGKGVTQDNQKAISYYESAAEKNSSRAQFTLGKLYEEGAILEKDLLESIKLYTKAASLGDKEAIITLSVLDADELNTNQFYDKQLELAYKIVKKQDGDILKENIVLGLIYYKLGIIYYNGFGVSIDYEKAWNFFTKSSLAYGGGNALEFSIIKYQHGDVSDIEAYLKKLDMWKTIAKKLKIEEIYELGLIHYYGIYAYTKDDKDYTRYAVLEPNYSEASKYFEMIMRKRIIIEKQFDFNGYNIELKELPKHTANQYYMHSSYYLGMIYSLKMTYNNINTQVLYYFNHANNMGHTNAKELLEIINSNRDDKTMIYERIFKWLEENKNTLDKSIHFYIGWMHLKGYGTTVDYKEAFKYFSPAAIQSHSDAQFGLGILYQQALGVEKDYKKAIDWMTKAADQNHIDASYTLGTIYLEGENVGKNYEKALMYFNIAAIQGHSDAQFKMGHIYGRSLGVEIDLKKTAYWFTKAADQNHKEASFHLGLLYDSGRGVNRSRSMAHKYLKMSADIGFSEAQHILGIRCVEGIDNKVDYKQAFKYFTKAANQSHIGAFNNLGLMYFKGEGVKKNYKLALKYSKKAANKGDVLSQIRMAEFYELGLGVEKDVLQVISWLKKAADQKHPEANYNLGRIYFIGDGIDKDYKLAFQYNSVAANLGHAPAQIILGNAYIHGYGVDIDYNMAVSIFLKVSYQINTTIFLGAIFHASDDKTRDFSKALKYYKNAPDDEKDIAYRGIGLLYEHGDGVEKNFEKALDYYNKSADMRNICSYYNIALLYYYGKGVTKDFGLAFEWFHRVIKEHPDEASTYVLIKTENGAIAETNIAEQKRYIITTETTIFGEAHYYLGIMNEKGQGTPKDTDTAIGHFQAAADEGIEEAEKYLKRTSN